MSGKPITITVQMWFRWTVHIQRYQREGTVVGGSFTTKLHEGIYNDISTRHTNGTKQRRKRKTLLTRKQ